MIRTTDRVVAGCTCRRRRGRAWTGRLLAAVLAVATMLGLNPAPALAAWQVAAPATTSGLIGVATPAYTFTGADPTTFTVNLHILSGLVTTFADFTNSGTVPATFTGTVDASAPGSIRVTVQSCSVAWVAGLCSATVLTQVNNILLSALPTLTYGPASPLTAGQKTYLKISTSSAFDGWIRLKVTSATLPVSNQNRTNG